MSAYRLPAAAVILTGDDLEAVAYAVAIAQRARRRDGLAPSQRLSRLAELVADPGHADSPQPVGAQDEHMSFITADAAAHALGVSTRTARRLAPGLGGRKVAGAWLIDADAVVEHREGMTA